jgi:hypothetical protein
MPRALGTMGGSSGAGWSSLAARRAHNPKVVGSNPTPATNQINDLETSPRPLNFGLCRNCAVNAGTIDAASLDARHSQATHSVAEPLGVAASSVRRTRIFHRPFIELRGTRREDSIAIACDSCWRAEPGCKLKRANASYDHRVFHQKVVEIIATSSGRSVPKFDVNTSPAHLTTLTASRIMLIGGAAVGVIRRHFDKQSFGDPEGILAGS